MKSASRGVRSLLIGGNIWYLGEGLLGPLFAVFAQRVGGDILEITWAWSVYLIVSGVLTVLVGKFADKYSKEGIMLFGYALNALMTFAYILVGTPFELFLVQVGLGVASALATPTWDALYDEYSGDGSKDGALWGMADGLPKIVMGVAVVIGGFIVTASSFTVLFITMGVIQVVATIVQTNIYFGRRHLARRN
jgi:MFS family permease